MKNFICITDFSSDELTEILNRADKLQNLWYQNKMPQTLQNQRIALWFWGNGFRNRIAFEIGARAMGADVAYIPGELGVNEPIQDIGYYLKNWFTLLVLRVKRYEDLCSVAQSASIPMINARTNRNHPCEIIGDLQYIRKIRGSINDLSVVFVGEVTNLCMSWFEAAVRFSISVIQVAPVDYLLSEKEVKKLNSNAKGKIATSTNLYKSVNKNTELIYTDCWPSSKDVEKIRTLFLPYQINGKILNQMSDKGFFLPCPPVTRGQEVSEESMASEKCKNYCCKEYLLHSQNAIMEYLASQN
jgi:ornithine carbamoyltransferase